MQLVLTIIAVISIQLFSTFASVDARNVKEKIKLRLYTGGNKDFHEAPIEQGLDLFQESSGYNKSLPIIFLVHGMAAGAESPFVIGMVDAFVERRLHSEYNCIAVDMPELFENNLVNEFYIGVLSNVEPAGMEIGEFLSTVISLGLTTADKINMMGYSIGAQVAGYAARLVKERFGQINYIVGLDPAGPGFHTIFGRASRLIHVSRADARIAHFFHTNSIQCGTRDRVGTADFVFNNGGTQPGCSQGASVDCSHIRVPYLYIEAVANPGSFVARHCPDWGDFISCRCNQQVTAHITFPPDEKARGIYYIRTRSKSLFGMGKAGAYCHKVMAAPNKTKVHAEDLLVETQHPLGVHKSNDILLPEHHRHFKDNINMHIINTIKKMEDYRFQPTVPEQTVMSKHFKNNDEYYKINKNEEELQILGELKHED